MNAPQPLPNDRFFLGGLMRCCTETLADMYSDGPARLAKEGQKLSCKYNKDNPSHQMIFTNGGWRWDRPEDESW